MTRIFDALAVPLIIDTGATRIINSQTITVLDVDGSDNVVRAVGTVEITNGGAGYAKGCLYIKTDEGAGLSGLHENIGTTSACEFVPIEGVTPAQLDLSNGKIFQGGAGNTAVQKTLGATFSGSALGTHVHAVTAANIASKVAVKRIYTGTVGGAGTGLVVGSTLLQATSTATGTVVALGTGYVDVNTTTGTFDATNLVTATNVDLSKNTFTPTMTAVDVWQVPTAVSSISAVASNSGDLALIQSTLLLTTGKCRLNIANSQIETLLSDGFTAVKVDYSTAVSAGTPAGTVTPTYS